MTTEELIKRLADIIAADERHVHYKHVCELAGDYRRIITNKDTDKFFHQVAKREEDEWFKQRKRLTNLVLMPMANHVLQPLRNVARSNDLKREITLTGDSNGTRLAELEALLSKFAGTKSLDNYDRNRLLRLSDIDPNAWVVIEWPTVDRPSAERVQPYPYEVTSEQAIMFEYKEYVLQYLTVMTPMGKSKKLNRYVIYGQNQTVVFEQFDNTVAKLRIGKNAGLVEYGDQLYFVTNNQYYLVLPSVPHDLGVVPAMRTGYHTDEYTDDTTYINTFHKALPYFMASVKAKSEFDLLIALHAFPIRLQYEQMCPICNGAKVDPDGKTCKVCNGTGTLLTTSTQDAITFPMPRDKEEFLPLESMIAYVRPPSDIIDVMVQNLDSLKRDAFEAIWGKNTFQEAAGTVTAEQILSQESSKYDNLYSCAEHLCDFWTFAAGIIARVTGIYQNGDIVAMSVGKEFSVKSKFELSLEYRQQKEAGMPAEIYNKTMRDIYKIDYSNEPDMLRKLEVRMKFKPFSDKSNDQVNIIITNKTETTLEDRVLWQNYEQIWAAIEMNDPEVYKKSIKEIEKILKKEVSKWIITINKQQSVTGELTFERETPDGTMTVEGDGAAPVDIEAEAKAKLKGTVGGVEGIIAVNQAIFEGRMAPEAAKVLLVEIYGFTPEVAEKLVKLPKAETVKRVAEIKDDIE